MGGTSRYQTNRTNKREAKSTGDKKKREACKLRTLPPIRRPRLFHARCSETRRGRSVVLYLIDIHAGVHPRVFGLGKCSIRHGNVPPAKTKIPSPNGLSPDFRCQTPLGVFVRSFSIETIGRQRLLYRLAPAVHERTWRVQERVQGEACYLYEVGAFARKVCHIQPVQSFTFQKGNARRCDKSPAFS